MTDYQNFSIYAGEDVTLSVNPVNNSAGSPYGDTSALNFVWIVTTSNSSSTALITKTSVSGITNGTSTMAIALADTDTQSLSPGTYYHECRTTDAAAEVVVFSGGMTIKASVTNL